MCVCAHDHEHFSGPDDEDHAVPVWRRARLSELRMRGVRGPRRPRTLDSDGVHSRRRAVHRVGSHRGTDAQIATGDQYVVSAFRRTVRSPPSGGPSEVRLKPDTTYALPSEVRLKPDTTYALPSEVRL